MSGVFDAKVDISTAETTKGFQALRKEVNLTGQSLSELDRIIKANKQNVVLIAQQFTKLVAEQRKAAAATKETAQADIAAARAAGIRNTAEAKVAESLARRTNQETQAARAALQGQLASARITDMETRRAASADRAAQATARAAAAQRDHHDSLSNSRYLMYDVGATYGVLSAGLLTIPAATAAVSAAYQRDFSQVIRVTEEFRASGDAAKEMKESLKGLAAEMPIAFDELSRITQLGAQMGIATDKLEGFTETTAKFVAVTGISADVGSTLFGRMETAFSEDVQEFPDFFERLGSSIAYVGAETIATDPEIAAMLSQIGPLGAAAGMSASEVTGLAAALASVRVRPELARGALTKVFANINRDVAEGSPRLAEYGKLLGTTAEGAKELWQTDSSKFFQNLIAGLNTTLMKNGELTTTLDKLGIKELRVSDAMTKLAVGYDVLSESMAAADKGFSEGTALNEMSKPVFDNVIAKLTMMANAWKNLGDTLGEGGLGPLGTLVDIAKNIAIGIDSMVKKVPAIGTLISLLMGFAAVTAVFLGFKAAQAFVMAGMIGFQQAAARGMGAGLSLSGSLRQVATSFLVARGASQQAAASLVQQVGVMGALTRGTQMLTVSNQQLALSGFAAARAGAARFGSSLLSLVGGPIGVVLGAMALLVGSFISAQVEAQQAGEAIAAGMAEGAESGERAIVESLGNIQVKVADGVIALGSLDKKFVEIARDAGVPFERLVEAAKKGTDAGKAVNELLDEIARTKGFKDAAAITESLNPEDMALAAQFGFLRTKVREIGEASVTSKKNLDDFGKAAPVAGKNLKDLGDGADESSTDIDELTKALKALNEEIFGSLDAQAALQDSLGKLGESIFESSSFDVGTDAGRANLKNLEESLRNAQDYYAQLKTTNQATAEEAAQGYADFVAGLMAEIQAKGGDLGQVESLANATKERFAAALGAGGPVGVPVEVDTSVVYTTSFNARTLLQAWWDNNEIQAKLGADVSEADLKLSDLANAVAEITGMPYAVVLDALTDPAHEKSREVEDLLIAITTGTYEAAVGADTSAAVTNIQNFVAYANDELARVHAKMNTVNGQVVGWADGEGSMSPEMKAQYGQITQSRTVRTPRAPVQVAPRSSSKPSNYAGLINSYNKESQEAAKKAADEAEKAAKKANKSIREMADGVDEATRNAEDFGNRLRTGLTSAFNQQYGLAKATDEYHSALNAINKKRADEIKQVEDLTEKIRQLNDERDKELITANKAKIEQRISIKYGEVDRAADYGQQATEALNNAAAKQREIDTARTEQRTIQDGIGLLTGYTDAAIANRAALRDLESKTIDMIAAYATQGHSIDEVRRYAQSLNGQFQSDVGQMGLNMAAVGVLQGGFERYIDVINRVPRYVPTEVEADTETASAEIAEFKVATDEATQPRTIPIDADTTAFDRKMEWIDAQIKGGKDGIGDDYQLIPFRPGTFAPVDGYNLGGPVRGFASGGMVPGTPPSDPRADNMLAKVDGKGLIQVRSREFIQPEESVDYYGPDFMEAVRTMKLPRFYAGGSPAGARGGSAAPAIVGLDAETLAALAAMKQEIKLFTENRVIAESANAGNRELAAEGRNR